MRLYYKLKKILGETKYNPEKAFSDFEVLGKLIKGLSDNKLRLKIQQFYSETLNDLRLYKSNPWSRNKNYPKTLGERIEGLCNHILKIISEK